MSARHDIILVSRDGDLDHILKTIYLKVEDLNPEFCRLVKG